MSNDALDVADSPSTRLVENIPTRPFLRRTLRKAGANQKIDSAINILRHEQRAAIVDPARRKARLRKVEFTGVMEAALVERVYSAFDGFFSDWRARMSANDELALKAIESIDRALSVLIGTTYTFRTEDPDGNELDPVFWDEDSAFEWLQDSLSEENLTFSPDEFFNTDQLSREIHHLWLARGYLIAEHISLYETLEAADDWELTPRVYTSSRLNTNIQQLIGDLCEAWLGIDPTIGLPDANGTPDNPLLRYLDACLNIVLGDKRPSKKTVLDFVKRQWKPNHWRNFDSPTLSNLEDGTIFPDFHQE